MNEILHISISRAAEKRPPAWALLWYRAHPWYKNLMNQIRAAQLQNDAKTLGDFRIAGVEVIEEFIRKNEITEISIVDNQVVLNIEVTAEVTLLILQTEGA